MPRPRSSPPPADSGPRASEPEGPAPAALKATTLRKRFGPRAVLDGMSLELDGGDLVAVMGRSGSGKSTLIHVLAGLDAPDEGHVWVHGTDVTHLPPLDRAEFRLHNIGVVFQHFNLIPDLTVLENVLLPLAFAHAPRASRLERGEDLLRTFGLADLADRFPDVLSGGELQRIAVARALAPRPAVLLADEPTGNLDEENARGVVDALAKAARAGAAVLVATHDALVSDAAKARYGIVQGRLAPTS